MSMQDPAYTAAEDRPRTRSYALIMKATALIGASFAVIALLSFLRMKVIALLLGPTGVGLAGMMTSIADLATAIVGLGVQQAGVRQIARADSHGADRLDQVRAALRWTSLVLGLLGTTAIMLLAGPIAQLTFGTSEVAAAVAIVSLAVFFRLVSGGQLATLQGLRLIGDLARINIVAATVSTIVCIGIVYVWRDDAIAATVVVIAASSTLVAWLYLRRTTPPRPAAMGAVLHETGALLHLGVAFLASGLLGMGAAYLIRIVILQTIDIHAAGLYQAAWAVAALYTGFVLQAMGVDFYPRLTALADDDEACNRLVNEQARISILLAGPGVIGTIAAAPLVLGVFYSAEFTGAATALRWICMGTMLQIMAWPLGFILVAKGAQRSIILGEALAAAIHVALGLTLIPQLGLAGAGLAFFGLYGIYNVIIYVMVFRSSRFRWSLLNLALGLVYLVLAGLCFLASALLPPITAMIIGLGMALTSGLASLWAIASLVAPDRVPAILRPALGWNRLKR